MPLLLAALLAPAAPVPPGDPSPVRLGSAAFRTPASALALSPGGKAAALLVPDGVDVMSLETGQVTARLRDAEKFPPHRVGHDDRRPTFGFAAGGREVVTCGRGGVWAWDAATGKPLRDLGRPRRDPKAAPADVHAVHNCQLADFLLAETGAGWQRLDAKAGTWAAVAGLLGGHDQLADVSPDGRWATEYTMVSMVENYVALVHTASGTRKFTGESRGDYPFDQTPSPDGKYLAVTVAGPGVQVWKVDPGSEVELKGIDRKAAHGTPRFTPDGKVLLVHMPGRVGKDPVGPSLARWDVATGARLSDWKLPGAVTAWAVDHANNRLVVLAGQCVFRLDLRTGKTTPPPDGFFGRVRPALSADGKAAAVGDAAGVIRVFADPFTGAPRTLRAGGPAVHDLAFSRDGRVLFAAYEDRSVGVWDVATGKETAVLKPPAGDLTGRHYRQDTTVAVSPDGSTVAAQAGMARRWAWDVPTGKVLWAEPADPDAIGCRPVFAPDGKALYWGRGKAVVVKFDPRTGKELGRVEVPGVPKWDVVELAVSADGTRFAAAVYKNDSQLAVFDWGLKEVAAAKSVPYGEHPLDLAFVPDGSAVLTAHPDGTVRSRRADAPDEAGVVVRGPAGYGARLQLSADGTRAVTAAPGATALVWKLK